MTCNELPGRQRLYFVPLIGFLDSEVVYAWLQGCLGGYFVVQISWGYAVRPGAVARSMLILGRMALAEHCFHFGTFLVTFWLHTIVF